MSYSIRNRDQHLTNDGTPKPANMTMLHRLGTLAAQRDIIPAHFPAAFDLS